MTQVVSSAAEARAALAQAAAAIGSPAPVIGLVPTMGALHPGHGAMLRAAKEHSDVVMASVFVNPLQFDDDADYQHYPRQLDADLAFLTEHGADLVFAPALEQMYPDYPTGPLATVSTGELGLRWEGASRPGHFDGMATVVAKLFNILTPPAPARLESWFGQKDAEQLAIVTRLVADLNLPVTIRSLPIVRDDNGLALSSRNQRLGAGDYMAALNLSHALFALVERAAAGRPLAVAELRAQLAAAEGVELDYFVVVDPTTLLQAQPGSALISGAGVLQSEALALTAARIGPVRLIDNAPLTPAGPLPG